LYFILVCPAVHSCKCDCKLIIYTPLTFIRGSNFDPELLFFPLTYQKRTRWYSELSFN